MIGVLALQGAFEAHQRSLRALGVESVQVRTPEQLAGVDSLVMPGGESTAMCRLLTISGLRHPLAQRLDDGMPAFGTCAGMILLASDVLDGRDDQFWFSAIDVTVRRNGYGRQIDSFEGPLDVRQSDGSIRPVNAVFIRAPKVERVGPSVDVLADIDSVPVLCRQGNVLVASFHPELSGDTGIHQRFVEMVSA
jgi:pyridoxal 5'-phosphate synthase pdxT subunit